MQERVENKQQSWMMKKSPSMIFFLPKYFVMSEKNVIFVMSKGNNNINTNSL